jgi:hypothetical protein
LETGEICKCGQSKSQKAHFRGKYFLVFASSCWLIWRVIMVVILTCNPRNNILFIFSVCVSSLPLTSGSLYFSCLFFSELQYQSELKSIGAIENGQLRGVSFTSYEAQCGLFKYLISFYFKLPAWDNILYSLMTPRTHRLHTQGAARPCQING